MSEEDYIRFNVEKWKKAHQIAEIRNKLKCTYEQAEQIYNDEKAKKICRKIEKFCISFFLV